MGTILEVENPEGTLVARNLTEININGDILIQNSISTK